MRTITQNSMSVVAQACPALQLLLVHVPVHAINALVSTSKTMRLLTCSNAGASLLRRIRVDVTCYHPQHHIALLTHKVLACPVHAHRGDRAPCALRQLGIRASTNGRLVWVQLPKHHRHHRKHDCLCQYRQHVLLPLLARDPKRRMRQVSSVQCLDCSQRETF